MERHWEKGHEANHVYNVKLRTISWFKSRINSVANIPCILYPTHIKNEYPMSQILDLLSHDLDILSKGIEIIIVDNVFLVFAYVWTLLGDYPFRREIAGFKVSPTSRKPCTVCQVAYNQYHGVGVGNIHATCTILPPFKLYSAIMLTKAEIK